MFLSPTNEITRLYKNLAQYRKTHNQHVQQINGQRTPLNESQSLFIMIFQIFPTKQCINTNAYKIYIDQRYPNRSKMTSIYREKIRVEKLR